MVAARAVSEDKRNTLKMTWNRKFLDLAWEHKFRIINYPTALEDISQIIGSNSFDLKKIGLTQYKEFMPAMEKANMPRPEEGEQDEQDEQDEDAMQIVRWDDGKPSFIVHCRQGSSLS
jgi:hypothetical protein